MCCGLSSVLVEKHLYIISLLSYSFSFVKKNLNLFYIDNMHIGKTKQIKIVLIAFKVPVIKLYLKNAYVVIIQKKKTVLLNYLSWQYYTRLFTGNK